IAAGRGGGKQKGGGAAAVGEFALAKPRPRRQNRRKRSIPARSASAGCRCFPRLRFGLVVLRTLCKAGKVDMGELPAPAVAVLGLTAGSAGALEIKNLRSTYGPVGSVRPGTKFLPGDAILLMFDIDGLKIDDKTATARYTVTLELFDTKNE